MALDPTEKVELDDIRDAVHKLETEKQNKIPVTVTVTFILWAFGVTWMGATKLAAIEASQNTLAEMIRVLAEDRYYGKDAARDNALQAQKNQTQDERIAENKQNIEQVMNIIRKLHPRIKQ